MTRPLSESERRQLRHLRASLQDAEQALRYYTGKAGEHGCENENDGAYYDGMADGASDACEALRREIERFTREGWAPRQLRYAIYDELNVAALGDDRAARNIEQYAYLHLLNSGNTFDWGEDDQA